jgi:hypothetical protein
MKATGHIQRLWLKPEEARSSPTFAAKAEIIESLAPAVNKKSAASANRLTVTMILKTLLSLISTIEAQRDPFILHPSALIL